MLTLYLVPSYSNLNEINLVFVGVFPYNVLIKILTSKHYISPIPTESFPINRTQPNLWKTMKLNSINIPT